MSHDQPSPTPPASELDEQLVAYLDGELDTAESRRIEALLARDAAVRERLQQLERTWDMLGELDRTPVKSSFTRTTLEMVSLAAAAEAERTKRWLPWKRCVRWLGAVVGLAGAACLGLAVTAWLWPDHNRQLLEDLPVIENLDQYRQVDNVQFLKLLAKEKLFETDHVADD